MNIYYHFGSLQLTANDAYLYNNTFINCHIKSGGYNGIIGINTGIGTIIDKIYISSCSVNSYGMFYFFGASSITTPSRISNFEIKDCIGDGISGKEWGNAIISNGTITNVTGDGIHFYHSAGYGMIKWWVENVIIDGAHEHGGIVDNGADQLTAYLYNNKINDVPAVYQEATGGPEYFYILNSSATNYTRKYKILNGSENREMREYVLADIYVIDKNNRPISQSSISIEAINPDVSDSIINRNFQPLNQSITISSGHTPLPDEDKDNTIALLRYKKTFKAEKGDYSYNITAEKNGIKATVTIRPEENWYRENPAIPKQTVVITLPLEQIGTIIGVVTNTKDSSVLTGATITAVARSATALTTITTDVNGRYTLTLPIGSYTLTVTKEGHRSQSSEVEIVENQTREINFSLFSGNIQDISVYPNPFKANQGFPGKIYFTNLPKEVTINIYTISGELIKAIEHRDSVDGGKEEWDVSDVSSGVYLYVVTSLAGVKKGKVGIIK